MTGQGTRFKAAGYNRLKPFIEVHGKPMIEWVVKMFSGNEDKVTFICQKQHLEKFDYMRPELQRISPKGTIFVVDNWKKKGPVNDVMRAKETINDKKPVIICYCDYYMHWDYTAFKKDVLKLNCDGAIPCYSGFHPHLIPEKNLYASCKVDKRDYLIEIKEKFSWQDDKTKAYHSPGMYYFKSGAIMKKYCQKMMDIDDNIQGEYYASLPYNYLVKDGLKVWCPTNVSHFCQWGTPEDLNEYLFWLEQLRE